MPALQMLMVFFFAFECCVLYYFNEMCLKPTAAALNALDAKKGK